MTARGAASAIELLAAIALAAIAVSALVPGAGVPALLQDWQWPSLSAQAGAFMTSGIEAWHRGGLGEPAVYPSPWLPYLVAGLACLAVGPHYAVVAILWALIVCSFLGVTSLCRTFQLPRVASSAAAAFYAAAPSVLNFVHAGHWLELWSYALLPVALARLRRPAFARSFLVDGVVIALACAQIQYVVMLPFCALVLGVQRTRAMLAPTALVAVAVISPMFVLGLIDPTRASLDVFHPYAYWVDSLSAPVACTLRALCYIGGYDASLSAIVRGALFAPLALVVAGAMYCSAGRKALVLLVASSLVVAGTFTILAPMWYAAFDKIDAFAVFREFYHASAIVELATALGIAAGLAALEAFRARLSLPFAIGTVALATTIAPSIASRVPEPDLRDQTARVVGGERFGIADEAAPWKMGESTAGYLPFVIGDATDAFVGGVPLKAPIRLAESFARRCDIRASKAIYERAAVARVIQLPDVSSASDRSIGRACSVGALRPAPRLDAPYAIVRFPIGPDAARIDPVSTDVRLDKLSTSPAASRAWARTALAPELPQWIDTEDLGLYTLLARATLAIPPANVLAGDASGKMRARGCKMRARVDAHFSLFSCERDPEFTGAPPLVVARVFRREPSPRKIFAAAPVTIVESSATHLKANVDAPRGALLVLREQFDRLWRIDVPARHVRVDGFYNGWIVAPETHGTIDVTFVGEAPHAASLTLSILVTVAALAIAILRRVS